MASADTYDVVVVGAGLGGLSASAFLAKAGKKVLVVDRLDGPGGYAHAFRRGDYTFDPAIHTIGQYRQGGELDLSLHALGVHDQVNMIPLDDFYMTIIPGYTFTAPFGVEEFTDTLVDLFSEEQDGIRRFMARTLQVKTGYDRIRDGMGWEEMAEGSGLDIQQWIRYRESTFAEVMGQYLKSPELMAIITAAWGYEGTPPSRLGYITYAGMLVSMLQDGLFYCEGSFQNLASAFVTALEENGGDLLLKTKVTRIGVRDGHVTGVTLEDDRQIEAPIVISNADATQTLEEMVGLENLPDRYVQRLKRMTPSQSAFLVYSASTLDFTQFQCSHEIFKFDSSDFEQVFQDVLAGKLANVAFTIPSLTDPTLAPPGHHIVTSLAQLPYDIGRPWPEAKEEYTEALLDEVEQVFPGYRQSIVHMEASTPLALERYSLNRGGAMYGWDNNKAQSEAKRLANNTPIEGLYLSSAWTRPGSGTIRVIRSGLLVAQMIEDCMDTNTFFRTLAPHAFA